MFGLILDHLRTSPFVTRDNAVIGMVPTRCRVASVIESTLDLRLAGAGCGVAPLAFRRHLGNARRSVYTKTWVFGHPITMYQRTFGLAKSHRRQAKGWPVTCVPE